MPTITQALLNHHQHTTYINRKQGKHKQSLLRYVPIDVASSHVVNCEESRSLQEFSFSHTRLMRQDLPALRADLGSTELQLCHSN
jgi:hypothetical protein